MREKREKLIFFLINNKFKFYYYFCSNRNFTGQRKKQKRKLEIGYFSTNNKFNLL